MLAPSWLWPPAADTAALYGFLIVAVRLIGRRQIGQLTVTDLLVIVLLGNAVETALIAGDVSLQAGLVSAATLLILNGGLNKGVQCFPWFRRLLLGGPVLLVHDGQVRWEALHRRGLTEADLMHAIREHQQERIEDVKYAVLETHGEITIVPKQQETPGGQHGQESAQTDRE